MFSFHILMFLYFLTILQITSSSIGSPWQILADINSPNQQSSIGWPVRFHTLTTHKTTIRIITAMRISNVSCSLSMIRMLLWMLFRQSEKWNERWTCQHTGISSRLTGYSTKHCFLRVLKILLWLPLSPWPLCIYSQNWPLKDNTSPSHFELVIPIHMWKRHWWGGDNGNDQLSIGRETL